MSARRVIAAVVIVIVILVGVYIVLATTAFGADLLEGLSQRPQQQGVRDDGPPEQWFEWQDVDGGRCFIDLDPKVDRASDKDNAQPIDCIPNLGQGIQAEIFALKTRSSSRGRDDFWRVECLRKDALPPCCLKQRPGMRATRAATEASGATDPRLAFGMLCRARYGCETDPVYTTGMVPWLAGNPINCLTDANVNTCVQLLAERVDPGTLLPNQAVVTPSNAQLMDYLCTNDAGTRADTVVSGQQLPRFTAEEFRTECLGQGFEPLADPGEGCAAGGARAGSGARAGAESKPAAAPSWIRRHRQERY